MKNVYLSLIAPVVVTMAGVIQADYRPAEGPLMTRWAAEVNPENVLGEYPRPQMVRKELYNLNGLWDYAIVPAQEPAPDSFKGKILVPFCVESALSGVAKRVGPDNRLWYNRTFTIPADWAGQRVLLHFEAADWETTVRVNDTEYCPHRGGYDHFCFDITDALKPAGDQQLTVCVWDPTDAGSQATGKQIRKPHSIWYTPVTGIWSTVWLEPVPQTYIKSLKIVPDIDKSILSVAVESAEAQPDSGAAPQLTIRATALDDGKIAATAAGAAAGAPLELKIPKPKLWSPDNPHLYDLRVELRRENELIDTVDSYFGMRKISPGKDKSGVTRILLNNQFLFQYGPLDQGWWPDGLYTAPTDRALRYDLEVTKKLGFNMLRKHVKVEPRRFYYWCDKLGLLVWQDMPNTNTERSHAAQSDVQFELELRRMIDSLYNHPSIVMWVVFNEGWGQYDTERMVKRVRQLDPTRLINNASGWTDKGVGDVYDRHDYPGPSSPQPEQSRAAVLGEFGGLGLPLEGHTWQQKDNWGYRSFETRPELTEAYLALMEKLQPLRAWPGLSAAVYTQTTDVEIEVNGLMTYDRAITKMATDRVAAANNRLYGPVPPAAVLLADAREQPVNWRHTTETPPDNWFEPGFDDSGWNEGPAGFGRLEGSNAVVRTEWTDSDIWLRRRFNLDRIPAGKVYLSIHHDEDARVYINGTLAAELSGYTRYYQLAALEKAGEKLFAAGPNVIAVHCRQTDGGQYIDVGLVAIDE